MTLAVKDGTGTPDTLACRTDGSGNKVITHDSIPFATPDLTWFVDQPTNADTDYDSVDCQRFSTIWLEFIMAGAASDAGDLYIEWSMDDTTFYPFAFDVGKWSSVDPDSKLAVLEDLGKITVAALANPTRFSLGVEKPPPYLRGRWDFTAGSATGMSGKSFGRG